MFKKLLDTIQDAKFLRRFHSVCTIIWILLIPPTIMFWLNSLPWLLIISMWATVMGHWASWQASRIEVKEDKR